MVAIHHFTVFIWFNSAQYNDEAEREGVPRIGTIDEAFEYQNTRSDFKCCNWWEKWKTICQATSISKPGIQGAFSDKVAPDIDGFTDELMWCSSCKKYFCR